MWADIQPTVHIARCIAVQNQRLQFAINPNLSRMHTVRRKVLQIRQHCARRPFV
jgi:hypothetical protein